MSPTIKISGQKTVLTYALHSVGELNIVIDQIIELLRRSGNQYEYLKNKKATQINIEQDPNNPALVRVEFVLPQRISDMSLSELPRG